MQKILFGMLLGWITGILSANSVFAADTNCSASDNPWNKSNICSMPSPAVSTLPSPSSSPVPLPCTNSQGTVTNGRIFGSIQCKYFLPQGTLDPKVSPDPTQTSGLYLPLSGYTSPLATFSTAVSQRITCMYNSSVLIPLGATDASDCNAALNNKVGFALMDSDGNQMGHVNGSGSQTQTFVCSLAYQAEGQFEAWWSSRIVSDSPACQYAISKGTPGTAGVVGCYAYLIDGNHNRNSCGILSAHSVHDPDSPPHDGDWYMSQYYGLWVQALKYFRYQILKEVTNTSPGGGLQIHSGCVSQAADYVTAKVKQDSILKAYQTQNPLANDYPTCQGDLLSCYISSSIPLFEKGYAELLECELEVRVDWAITGLLTDTTNGINQLYYIFDQAMSDAENDDGGDWDQDLLTYNWFWSSHLPARMQAMFRNAIMTYVPNPSTDSSSYYEP